LDRNIYPLVESLDLNKFSVFVHFSPTSSKSKLSLQLSSMSCYQSWNYLCNYHQCHVINPAFSHLGHVTATDTTSATIISGLLSIATETTPATLFNVIYHYWNNPCNSHQCLVIYNNSFFLINVIKKFKRQTLCNTFHLSWSFQSR
jgi:hypothetical protein